jgi:hypothetical protein
MKIQLTFTDANSRKEFKKTVEFEYECLMDLLTDEAVYKIFNTKMEIKEQTRSIIFLKGIKDIDD